MKFLEDSKVTYLHEGWVLSDIVKITVTVSRQSSLITEY